MFSSSARNFSIFKCHHRRMHILLEKRTLRWLTIWTNSKTPQRQQLWQEIHNWTPKISNNMLFSIKDSDWAIDSQHRKLVTWIVIMLDGAAVLYKSCFQDTIALSSTEFEFIAAVEVGNIFFTCVLFSTTSVFNNLTQPSYIKITKFLY